jgi:glycosyltransferase involved in cell wall biosynthesis
LKIVYVTASLPHGPDEAFIVPEVNQLTRSGHEVLVIPRSPSGRILHGQDLLKQSRREALYSAGVLKSAVALAISAPLKTAAATWVTYGSRSLAVSLKNLAVVPKALWLADVAAQWGADHIHCHWGGTTATLSMLASRVSGIPWSLTLHRWDIVENNLLAAKVKSASFVRFISQDGLRMAEARGVTAGDNVRVLHMGVEIPAAVKRRAGAIPVALCPARLVEVKGHRFLLEAWQKLRDRGCRGELWLAGDGELRGQLEALAETLGLGASVKFLGALPHHELLRFYEDGDVSAVVMSSIDLGNGNHEGIPVALIEAMSYGIPVVATTTGGTVELVKPGTGLLAPPQDPAALADSLQSLLEDQQFAQQIGESGRQRVLDDFDIVRVASELARAFDGARRQGVGAVAQYA